MLKRFAYTLMAPLLLLSCTEKEMPRPAAADVIFVTIGGDATKTQLGTSGKLSWSKDDRIGVFSNESSVPVEFKLRSGAGYSVASFEGTAPKGELFHAYFPADARCDGITFRSILPTMTKHSVPTEILENMPLYGTSRDVSDITVNSLCGVLQFNLTGNGRLKSIILEAEKAISGEFLYTLQGGIFAMTKNGSHIISMDASSTELSFYKPTPFYFLLPPGEYEDIRFTVTDAEGGSTVFSAGETLTITAGKVTEASSVAPDVDLIGMQFVPEKNNSGCFWYTTVTKNPSFCVSYLFGIATKAEFEAYDMDAPRWLEENGRICTSTVTDMHVVLPGTEYVALAQATSVSGSKDAPVIIGFTTPQISYNASIAASVTAENITGRSVSYKVALPSSVEYLSEVKILSATEFDKLKEEDIIVECLATRKRNRELSGSFSDLLPGIEYVIYCVCDNEQSVSPVSSVRFRTLGSNVGGDAEDISEIEVK